MSTKSKRKTRWVGSAPVPKLVARPGPTHGIWGSHRHSICGGHLEDKFALKGTPVRCHVGGNACSFLHPMGKPLRPNRAPKTTSLAWETRTPAVKGPDTKTSPLPKGRRFQYHVGVVLCGRTPKMETCLEATCTSCTNPTQAFGRPLCIHLAIEIREAPFLVSVRGLVQTLGMTKGYIVVHPFRPWLWLANQKAVHGSNFYMWFRRSPPK